MGNIMEEVPLHQGIHPDLRADMLAKRIDIDLALNILDRYNRGDFDHVEKIVPAGVPPIDGIQVVDVRNRQADARLFKFPKRETLQNLGERNVELPEGIPETTESGTVYLLFDAASLESIGRQIVPRCAYGVLNGGSATSYADLKKNRAIDEALFSALKPAFERYSSLCRDLPKGLTPAYINPDGSPGASFLELKMRARLLAWHNTVAHNTEARTAAKRAAGTPAGANHTERVPASPNRAAEAAARANRAAEMSATLHGPLFMPLYQMTSTGNHDQLLSAYVELSSSPFLSTLSLRTGLDAAQWLSGKQPLIAAYTHSSEGRPKRIFDRAYGKEHCSLALPGGHGQCFMVLADIFRALQQQGIRYAMLSNVDNLGAFVDPVELAILAISGKPAGFDFAFRTPIDVKGGILVRTQEGTKNVVDIGPAIDIKEVETLEKQGESILFNCATGIFDLEWLVPNLGKIAHSLPVRFTDQVKDAGSYSQAEQVTWEIVSLLPDFVAFAVNKEKRFLAAKMLAEMLLTSGFGNDVPSVPAVLRQVGTALHNGQNWLLSHVYGLELVNGRWVPPEIFKN